MKIENEIVFLVNGKITGLGIPFQKIFQTTELFGAYHFTVRKTKTLVTSLCFQSQRQQ